MKKETKYNYWNVIQQHYGQGWEDVSHYEATSTGVSIEQTEINSKRRPGTKIKVSLLSQDLKEYQMMEYATRVIFRKELKQLETV